MNPDKRRVYHWTRRPQFKTTDPNFLGSGFLGKSTSFQLPGTFFGEEEYRELYVQANAPKYFAYLDYTEIYDYDEDPQKFLQVSAAEAWKTGGPALLIFEKILQKEGYKGYSTHFVVKYFESVDVFRDYELKELRDIDAEKFSEAVLAVRKAHEKSGLDKQLTLYSVQDYRKMRMFLGREGTAGFALQGDNIVSVFAHPLLARGASPNLLDWAVQKGGRRVDIFDTYLPKLYAREGFRTVARMLWDEQYSPVGWNYEAMKQFNNGRPDVIFMAYDPSSKIPLVGSYEEAEILQRSVHKMDGL